VKRIKESKEEIGKKRENRGIRDSQREDARGSSLTEVQFKNDGLEPCRNLGEGEFRVV